MLSPEYLICLECESPCYVFEWRNSLVREALCEVCGNEDPTQFVTEGEYEDMAMDRRYTPPSET